MLPSLNRCVLLEVLPSASKDEIESAFHRKLRNYMGVDDFFENELMDRLFEASQQLLAEIKTNFFLPVREGIFKSISGKRTPFLK